MNKAELIEKIAKKTGLAKTDAGRALDATLVSIKEAIAKNNDVVLIGFGTFSTSKRSARTGRNPQTGAALKIPASVVPKFKAGKALKDAVKKK
jgi:DNA-binding protein HU-beta